MEKRCLEHGFFRVPVWRGKLDYGTWVSGAKELAPDEGLSCPGACGLCAEHQRATCCSLLEVTNRCNLRCSFCFAHGAERDAQPSLESLKSAVADLMERCGKPLLQLSGGEPTVRDDLPEIVAYAKQAGCKYVQLNSNGLRLAEDEAFVKRLADAGLSFVFMQFDGVDDAVYEKLRRRPMLEVKKRAIEQCGRYGIGVTLVPVIVPGVNTEQIGDIIRFAIQRSPYVRGVHFQPVSYFGRIPELPADDDRYTLDELLEAVVSQSGGLIKEEQIAPSCCDHPMCGFHGDFIVMPGDKLMPLTNYSGKTETEPEGEGCCCGPDPAEKNREFVGRRWERRDVDETCCCGESQPEMYTSMISHGPIERGLDMSRGGVDIVNFACDATALATTANSLAAIEQRVVKEKRLTWEQLVTVLKNDFEGAEDIRLMLKSVPQYGAGGTAADRYAKYLADLYTHMMRDTPTRDGFIVLPGIFSHGDVYIHGKHLGATPNGRHAGGPISHSADPDPGFLPGGGTAPTAKANAVASVQSGWGTALCFALRRAKRRASGS